MKETNNNKCNIIFSYDFFFEEGNHVVRVESFEDNEDTFVNNEEITKNNEFPTLNDSLPEEDSDIVPKVGM